MIPGYNLYFVSGSHRITRTKAVAAAVRVYDMSKLVINSFWGGPAITVRPFQYSIEAGYSQRIADASGVAITGRYIYSDLYGNLSGTRPARSLAGDISYYGYTRDTNNNLYSWGIIISNIGSKLVHLKNQPGEFLPTNLRIGGHIKHSFTSKQSLSMAVDLNKLLIPTTPEYLVDPVSGSPVNYGNGPVIVKGKDPNRHLVDAMTGSFSDAPGGAKEELREVMANTGIEYSIRKLVAAHAGYSYTHKTKGYSHFTLGLGGEYKRFALDLSYLFPVDNRSPYKGTWRTSLNVVLSKTGTSVPPNISF
jgi:hypothetical protein